MKKWLACFFFISLLSACANESDESEIKNADSVAFSPLNTNGINLPEASNAYALPTISKDLEKVKTINIAPPAIPLAIIKHSMTHFDGQRAIIVYPENLKEVYSLAQVQRLFKEDGITSSINHSQLITDWATIDDIQIRYQVEQVNAQNASALTVSIYQTRQKDGTIFTLDSKMQQRYAVSRLNQIISTLNAAYNKQIELK